MKFEILSVAAFLCSLNDVEALQNLFNLGRGGTTKTSAPFGRSNSAPPLNDRVDLGTLSVSPMGLGTLNLPLDKAVDDETTEVLKVATEFNVNFCDTAEAVRIFLVDTWAWILTTRIP